MSFQRGLSIKPLKKLFSIFQGYSFSSKDSVEEGTRWLKIADVSIQNMKHNNPSFLPDDYTNIYEKFLIKKGDYVLALTRPILNGKLKISAVDNLLHNSLLNQRVGKLVSNENLTLVYYLLQTNYLIDEIEKSIAGSEPPNLSMKQIENIPISLPSNPKEQKKIANCLSSLDTLITAETEKLAHLKDHKKGLLQQLFPANGETKPQYRFPEFENDGDWEERELGEICNYFNGGSHENNVVDNGKYNLISLNSIDIEGHLKSKMKTVNHTDNSLNKNDIVMVLSDVAYGNFLGLSAIIPNNNYVLNQRMAGLRLNDNQDVNVEYLRLFINNNQKYFKQKGQGSSQQNLAKPSVEKFPVLISSKPKEQQKIANCFSSLDDLIETQTTRIEALKEHKKGLMQQLFPTINELAV